MHRTVTGIACGVLIAVLAALGAQLATEPARLSAGGVDAVCSDPAVAPGDVRATPHPELCGPVAPVPEQAVARADERIPIPARGAPRILSGLACASAATLVDAAGTGCGAWEGWEDVDGAGG